MTSETSQKNRGGRPKIETPATAEATRLLIAHEVAHQNRTERLRSLYRLLKAFERAEQAIREDAKVKALADSNHLKWEELALRKSDYRLRFASKPLGVRNLLTESEKLKARIRTLEVELAKNLTIDCGTMQEKSSETRNDVE
jgi:hypothetical protein